MADADFIFGLIGLVIVANLFRRGYFIIRRLFVKRRGRQLYAAHGVFHRLRARDSS